MEKTPFKMAGQQHTVRTGIDWQDDDAFYASYYGTTMGQCERHNIHTMNTDLDIYITSFDGLIYAKHQVKMLNHFLKDVNFHVIFCDTNSHINPIASEQTRRFCIDEEVGYIKLPHNKFQDMQQFSFKLGTDMNWIWRNVVKVRKTKYFGFLDQDNFLISPIWKHLKTQLDTNGMYGYVWPAEKDTHIDKTHWLLHVISNFFRYDFVENRGLDFRPFGAAGLDTGGCNYFTLLKDYNREDYLQLEEPMSKYSSEHLYGYVFREFTMYDSGKWLHIMNSVKSYTNHPYEKMAKEIYMAGVLNGILLNDKT